MSDAASWRAHILTSSLGLAAVAPSAFTPALDTARPSHARCAQHALPRRAAQTPFTPRRSASESAHEATSFSTISTYSFSDYATHSRRAYSDAIAHSGFSSAYRLLLFGWRRDFGRHIRPLAAIILGTPAPPIRSMRARYVGAFSKRHARPADVEMIRGAKEGHIVPRRPLRGRMGSHKGSRVEEPCQEKRAGHKRSSAFSRDAPRAATLQFGIEMLASCLDMPTRASLKRVRPIHMLYRKKRYIGAHARRRSGGFFLE